MQCQLSEHISYNSNKCWLCFVQSCVILLYCMLYWILQVSSLTFGMYSQKITSTQLDTHNNPTACLLENTKKLNPEKKQRKSSPLKRKREMFIHSFTHKESLLACMPALSINPLLSSLPPVVSAERRKDRQIKQGCRSRELGGCVYVRSSTGLSSSIWGIPASCVGSTDLGNDCTVFQVGRTNKCRIKSVCGGPMIHGRKSEGKYFFLISM